MLSLRGLMRRVGGGPIQAMRGLGLGMVFQHGLLLDGLKRTIVGVSRHTGGCLSPPKSIITTNPKPQIPWMLQNLIITRGMNRNARRPKKANHGKRPVSHARRRQKAKSLKSRAYREKVFGFW